MDTYGDEWEIHFALLQLTTVLGFSSPISSSAAAIGLATARASCLVINHAHLPAALNVNMDLCRIHNMILLVPLCKHLPWKVL